LRVREELFLDASHYAERRALGIALTDCDLEIALTV